MEQKSSTPENLSGFIKQTALDLGFSFCGISKARELTEMRPYYEKWLKNNFHASMSYMENNFEKRLDPTKLEPGTKSIISLMMGYFPQENLPRTDSFNISKYAFGKDYHHVIKEKITELIFRINEKVGSFNARSFVDSAPILEKAWAVNSGLGWIGKNSLLIHPKAGSFFFVAELFTDLELDWDTPLKNDYCGHCTKCIDLCPTNALRAPRVVDAGRCIAYITLEYKDEIPEFFKGKNPDWILGCDICQDVCPWNKFSIANKIKEFQPHPKLLDLSKKDWEELNQEMFSKLFGESAFKRIGFQRVKRNINFFRNA